MLAIRLACQAGNNNAVVAGTHAAFAVAAALVGIALLAMLLPTQIRRTRVAR